MMRIVDTLYAIPFLVLVIVLKVVIAGRLEQHLIWMGRFSNIVPLFFAIGALGWLTLARITRAQVMAIKEQEFVEAAESLGLSRMRILFRHIVPNTIGASDRLCHADDPELHPLRGVALLPRCRRRGAQQLVGHPDQGGCQPPRDPGIAAHHPRLVLFPDPICPQLPRRRPEGRARREGIKGLIELWRS